MKKSMPILSNVMVIGDKKPYPTMFVTLKCQVLKYIQYVYMYNCYRFACYCNL